MRHELHHQHRICQVSASLSGTTAGLTDVWIKASDDVLVQNSGDHSGENHHKKREDFKVAREDNATFGMRYVFGRERPLHDHLIRAPVPRGGNGETKRDSGPWQITIRRGSHEMHEIGWNGVVAARYVPQGVDCWRR